MLLETTKRGYEAIAAAFSDTRNRSWDDVQCAQSFIAKQSTVLDVGCGNGRMYEEFRGRVARYIGIDRSAGLIARARELHKTESGESVSFDVCDIANSKKPLPKNDVSLCVAVLAHIPSRDLQMQVLRSIYDALEPGGTLVMTNWNLWRLTVKQKSVWKYALEKFFMPRRAWKEKFSLDKRDTGFRDCLTDWNGAGAHGVLYYYAFTAKELSAMLRAVGFSDVSSMYVIRGEKALWRTGHNILSVAHKK